MPTCLTCICFLCVFFILRALIFWVSTFYARAFTFLIYLHIFLCDVSFQVPYMLSFLTVLIFLPAFSFLRAYILFTCFLFPYILSHFLHVFIFVKCFKVFAYHPFLDFCMPFGASFFSSQFQIKEGRGKSIGWFFIFPDPYRSHLDLLRALKLRITFFLNIFYSSKSSTNS